MTASNRITSTSQIPHGPTFRSHAINKVAVVPLLTTDAQPANASSKSFQDVMQAVCRHTKLEVYCTDNDASAPTTATSDGVVLVVPNSNLTQPGDWRYNESPLKAFHWQHGCQRLHLFDGRPSQSRHAHDRLMNHSVGRDWIDLLPSRRTAAVVGVLNLHDCKDSSDLKRAEEELHMWASRFATPPYEVTAHGRDFARDRPVERLFVFDSFDEECQVIDLNQHSSMESTPFAFPPYSQDNLQMMDVTLNVGLNDLAVAIFRDLEDQIKRMDALNQQFETRRKGGDTGSNTSRRRISNLIRGTSTQTAGADSDEPSSNPALSLKNLASLVNPENKLAQQVSTSDEATSADGSVDKDLADEDDDLDVGMEVPVAPVGRTSSDPQLLTPMDEEMDSSSMSPKDMEGVRRRDMGRRVKRAADLALLAGAPLDAYERYLKAAQLTRTGAPDPLWYSFALIGCAAAHIAMAEAGGYAVDEYLDKNFQYPDEIMALVKKDVKDEKSKTPTPSTSAKQTMPEIIFALCDEALSILCRSAKLCPLQAELLLSMAEYTSEWAEFHLRCRWGEGEGCYQGELADEPRWLKTTVSSLQFHDLRTRSGEDMTAINSFVRVKQTCELMQQAVAIGALDPSTRVDVAMICANACLRGMKASCWRNQSTKRVVMPRKAAFFATVLAETLSSEKMDADPSAVIDSWIFVCRMYSSVRNARDGTGRYGWASLRATILSALSMQGDAPASQEAARHLLELLGETETHKTSSVFASITKEAPKQKRKPLIDSAVRESAKAAETPQVDDAPTWSQSPAPQSAEGGGSAETGPSSFASKLKQSFATMTTTYPMLVAQAKWASEDPAVPSMLQPLVDFSDLATQCYALNCVWTVVEHKKCTEAQKNCMSRINALARSVAVTSARPSQASTLHPFGPPQLPIQISSAEAIQVDSILELECTKRKVVKKDEGAMSTFFNPFENKRKGTNNVTRVAEEEERAFLVQMNNRLSVPLAMSRCQLVFDKNENQRIQSTSLSFLLPPKAKAFTVNFPFTVQPLSSATDEDQPSETFEVRGIKFVCLGRAIFSPIASTRKTQSARSTVPETIASYPHLSKKKSEAVEDVESIRLEAFPCQPRLTIVDDQKGAPLPTEAELKVRVTSSELTDLPALRVENYTGPSGKGRVERLQILIVGIPGSADKVLYDSEDPQADPQAEKLAMDDFASQDQSSPVRFWVRESNLDLAVVNDNGLRAKFVLSMATARNAGDNFPSETLFTLRLRYRGRSTVDLETWRKRDVPIRLNHFRGPRIASLVFSPDLLSNALFAECNDLLRARKSNRREEKKDDSSHAGSKTEETLLALAIADGSYVASSDFVVTVSLTNPVSSNIIVSRDGGPVGGLRDSDVDEIEIHHGVNATLPIVLPRFVRTDICLDQIANEIAFRLKFRWRTKSEENFTSGRITLPAQEVQRLMRASPVLIGHLCESPCSLSLHLMKHGDSDALPCTVSISPGQALTLAAQTKLAAWINDLLKEGLTLTIELFCVRRDKGGRQRGYVWSGRLRCSFDLKVDRFEHKATIMFTEEGRFSLSCCARISNAETDVEEVWWLPSARDVVVQPL